MTGIKRGVRGLTRGTVFAAILAATASSCTDTTHPGYVDRVNVYPEIVGFAPGDKDTLEAKALDKNGQALPDRLQWLDWAVLNESVVTVVPLPEGKAEVTGVGLGSTRVEATLGRGRGDAFVNVHPPGLARIAIDPNPVRTTLGRGVTVEARLYDASDSIMSPEGFFISWSIADNSIAWLDGTDRPSLMLFPKKAGTTSLRLRVGGRSTTAEVIVE
jgi:hypothetical protein